MIGERAEFEQLRKLHSRLSDEMRRKSDELLALSVAKTEQDTKLAALEERCAILSNDLSNCDKPKEDIVKLAWKARDEAVERKNNAEISLAKTRIENMQISSQLMEVVQQKGELSQKLAQFEVSFNYPLPLGGRQSLPSRFKFDGGGRLGGLGAPIRVVFTCFLKPPPPPISSFSRAEQNGSLKNTCWRGEQVWSCVSGPTWALHGGPKSQPAAKRPRLARISWLTSGSSRLAFRATRRRRNWKGDTTGRSFVGQSSTELACTRSPEPSERHFSAFKPADYVSCSSLMISSPFSLRSAFH